MAQWMSFIIIPNVKRHYILKAVVNINELIVLHIRESTLTHHIFDENKFVYVPNIQRASTTVNVT